MTQRVSASTKALPNFEEKFIPEPMSGCWLWIAAVDPKGYGRTHCVGIRRTLLAHRVAWELYRGEIPVGLMVLHHCDVPCCVNPDHLFLGTQQDNMNDCFRKRRNTAGVKSNLHKLTEDQVLAIRADARGKRKLSIIYGVSIGAIAAIRGGRSWKQLLGPPANRDPTRYNRAITALKSIAST